jgi:hypothetical protein
MAFRETQDHIMYNMCAKFHQNPCINLGGVGGTNLCLQTDRQTDRQTDTFQYTPPNFVVGGIISIKFRRMRNSKFESCTSCPWSAIYTLIIIFEWKKSLLKWNSSLKPYTNSLPLEFASGVNMCFKLRIEQLCVG